MEITTFVLKIASRCNLNCSYCYMYNKGDNTFETQPKFMSLETINHLADRISTHIGNLDLDGKNIHITFHGGEPMLASKYFFKKATKILNSKIRARIIYSIQTNGTLLSAEWIDLFNELEINIGISIDGPKEYHDFYRKFHNDNGSYDIIFRNLENGALISKFGILFVVNPLIPAKKLYSFIKEKKIGILNLLLPDHHYEDVPNFVNPNDIKIDIGNWMVELYQLWKLDIERPNISFFENIIKSFFELSGGTQILGRCFNDVVCIETDGSIEVVDSLRTCENGITKNNLNVKYNNIEDIFENELYKLYYYSHFNVNQKCKECEVLNFCGGGFLPHRYSKINKFDNQSIYCNDLFKLITYIEKDIKHEIKKHAIN